MQDQQSSSSSFDEGVRQTVNTRRVVRSPSSSLDEDDRPIISHRPSATRRPLPAILSVSTSPPPRSPSPLRAPHLSPALRDLFTPPIAGPPPPRNPSPAQDANATDEEDDLTSVRSEPLLNKGKARVNGERPRPTTPDGMPESPYYPNLMMSRNSTSYRVCKLCKAAGGQRAENSVWCKGRRTVTLCQFKAGPSDMASQRSRSFSREGLSSTPAPINAVKSKAYYDVLAYSRNGVTVKRCRLCIAAGGERKEKAVWCRGRRAGRLCSFNHLVDSDQSDDEYVDTLDQLENRDNRTSDAHDTASGPIFANTLAVSSAPEAVRRIEGRPQSISIDTREPSVEEVPVLAEALAEAARSGSFSFAPTLMSTMHLGTISVAPPRQQGRPHESSLESVEPPEEPTVIADPLTGTEMVETPRTGVNHNMVVGTGERTRSVSAARQMPTPLAPPGLDQRRYHAKGLWNHLGSGLRRCRPCAIAGGLRKERAPWCRGRVSWKDCAFAADESPILDDAEQEEPIMTRAPVVVVRRPVRTIVISSESEAELPSALPLEPLPIHSDRIEQSPSSSTKLDPRRYYHAIQLQHNTLMPRICRHCRRSNGERRERATLCKGRTWAKFCTFVIDAEKGTDVFGDNTSPTRDAVSIRRRAAPTIKPDDLPYYNDMRYAAKSHTPVACKACRASGGIRGEKAFWCKGRRHPNLCSFLTGPTTLNTVLNDFSLDPALVGVDANNDPGIQAFLGDDNASVHSDDSLNSLPRSGSEQVRDNERAIPTPPPSSPARDSPPIHVFSSHSSPLPAARQETPRRRFWATQNRSTSLSRAHSPESSVEPLRSIERPTQSTAADPVRSRPTPSPSVSTIPAPEQSLSMPPSSPPRPTMPLRTSSIIRRVTPASAGARSSSGCSDHTPIRLLFPRKSALRRPSDSGSAPVSTKRARFSLEFRSPLRDASSDPVAEPSGDEDELLLQNDSSPRTSYTPSSPAYDYDYPSSSSPFSREMSVRAADMGISLGPEHTGRLPSGMLAALAPALTAGRPTATPTFGSSAFVLPQGRSTPPASFGSTSSHVHAASSPIGSTGLMLPPPIPTSKQISASTRELATAQTPISFESTPISIKTLSPAYLRARSRTRSRSISVLRTPAPKAPPMRVAATTPRKKSRIERDLARVARDLGDDAGLEWGMDEEVGPELSRIWREGSVVTYVQT